jgi:DNA-binding response OmpR family regulator
MALVSDASASVEFGRYTVEPHRREPLADGRPIKLGGRAFDLLMALIEASGAVVSKDVPCFSQIRSVSFSNRDSSAGLRPGTQR